MASIDNHFRQAQINFQQLQILLQASPTFDWVITVSYYAALHLLNGHLASFKLHPVTHQETIKNLRYRNVGINAQLLRNYSELQNFSRDARYIGTLDQDYEEIPNINDQDIFDALEYLESVLEFIKSLYPVHPLLADIPVISYNQRYFFQDRTEKSQ